MKNTLLLIAIVFVSFNLHAQKKYKPMMNDLSINFYEVCEEAEKYFESHAKGKGSGWKGYQRWRNSNEYKYYPDGVRSNVDPYFVEKAFKAFKSKGTSNDKNLFG
ncbi:MAG: hypothetical protein HRT73_14175, partial [Flavobacteriales bacterium]|nr:hypothetical protein [Flavobacteriales bacterium]